MKEKEKEKKEKKEKCEECKKAFCDRCRRGIGTIRDSCKRCEEIDCNDVDINNNNNNPCNPSYGYKMITPTLSIGTLISSSSPFDVIIDLNYPSNGAEEDMIDIIKKEDKIFFLVGMNVKDHLFDGAGEYNGNLMSNLLSAIIPMLLSVYYQHPSYRFLFKCFGGLHRSLTLAVAFFCITKGLSLEKGYHIINSIMKPVVSIKDKKMKLIIRFLKIFYINNINKWNLLCLLCLLCLLRHHQKPSKLFTITVTEGLICLL